MLTAAHAGQLPLADGSVQCVVTSPPYWGLRKYAGEQEVNWAIEPSGHRVIENGSMTQSRNGTIRCAYGLEPTVEMYVAHTVEILREVRRVLRADGVCFWNLGDSYAAPNGRNSGGVYQSDTRDFGKGTIAAANAASNRKFTGLKPKDLCLIPQRVALAAQADGWWVRSLIVWAKPNPMPESVTDRPTDAYEFVLMLAKRPRYFWDAEAVKESANPETQRATSVNATESTGNTGGNLRTDLEKNRHIVFSRNLRNVWTFPTQPYSGAHFATFPEELPRRCILAATSAKGACAQCGAPWERVVSDKRPATGEESWKGSQFDTGKTAEHQGQRMQRRSGSPHDGKTASAYEKGSNAHRIALLRQAARERGGEYVNETRTIGWIPGCECYGTPLPPRLPEMPEDAEEPEACRECGGSGSFNLPLLGGDLPCEDCAGSGFKDKGNALWHAWREEWEQVQVQRLAILSSIEGLDLPVAPCVVLDPFGGSGTTGRVAVELGRRAVLCDLGFAHPSHKLWLDWRTHEELSETTDYGLLAAGRTKHIQRQLVGL